MAHTYTIDASVFLNAFNPAEAGHTESHQLLALLQLVTLDREQHDRGTAVLTSYFPVEALAALSAR